MCRLGHDEEGFHDIPNKKHEISGGSESDPKRLFPDPDQTFQVILDPDPFLDPGQNQIFKEHKKLFTNHSAVFRIGLLYCFH